jgi:hypothetical protein
MPRFDRGGHRGLTLSCRRWRRLCVAYRHGRPGCRHGLWHHVRCVFGRGNINCDPRGQVNRCHGAHGGSISWWRRFVLRCRSLDNRGRCRRHLLDG